MKLYSAMMLSWEKPGTRPHFSGPSLSRPTRKRHHCQARPNFHALSRLGLLDGVEQETQRGACPRETVETVLDGGCWALGRRPLPRRLQRVERRMVTRSGEVCVPKTQVN